LRYQPFSPHSSPLCSQPLIGQGQASREIELQVGKGASDTLVSEDTLRYCTVGFWSVHLVHKSKLSCSPGVLGPQSTWVMSTAQAGSHQPGLSTPRASVQTVLWFLAGCRVDREDCWGNWLPPWGLQHPPWGRRRTGPSHYSMLVMATRDLCADGPRMSLALLLSGHHVWLGWRTGCLSPRTADHNDRVPQRQANSLSRIFQP
jgi:hypothetical protein